MVRVTGLYEDLNLRIPAGTSSHTEMTLSGRGIKYMDSSNQYGDHIVHITIKMPTRLTEEQRALIREFARTERDQFRLTAEQLAYFAEACLDLSPARTSPSACLT